MSETIRTIRLARRIDVRTTIPPSKSYTARALLAAALAEGTTILKSPSQSDDSNYLINALRQFGVGIRLRNGALEIDGTGGCLQNPGKEIFVGNAGTALRFLTTFACMAPGETVITGDEALQRRPVSDLLAALQMAGIKCTSKDGFPPVTIQGGVFSGGRVDIKADVSSQFVSSLLLSAPYAKRPLSLYIKGRLSSLPYVDMSLHVMRSFGADIDIVDPSVYHVNNRQKYIGHDFMVEGDATSATYFFAAAAITGGRCIVENLSPDSLQGDVKFVDLLGEMGCIITKHENAIEVQGGKLFGIEANMNDMPDCVPTLAILAAFADGPTTITNVAHLRFKESDRLAALSTELTKLGVRVEEQPDGLTIHPQTMHGSIIETYNDHRIAMSFAVAGLRTQGIGISNPACVAKSFPNFWDEFSKLESMVK